MNLTSYKQYIDKGLVFGLFRGDCYSVGEEMLVFAGESFLGDYCDMSFHLIELDVGDDDFGDYVFLEDDKSNQVMASSPRFRNVYMKVFCDEIPKWHLVKVDITLEYMKLFYMRFDSEENDECDEYEVLRINYPKHMRFHILVAEREQDHLEKYAIDISKKEEGTPHIKIEEYDSRNEVKTNSVLMSDQRGIYLQVTDLCK